MEKQAKKAENFSMIAPRLVNSECPSTGRVSNFSYWKTVDKINQKLTMQQKIMFHDSCFGQFLNLGLRTARLQFSGQLIHQLLVREVESANPNEMWFLVGEKTIRFSMQEFCIVTGLKCSPSRKIDTRNVKGVRLLDEVFHGNMDLKISDLETAFLEGSGSDETMVKLAMLYFLESVLLGRDKRCSVHDKQHILLVDDFHQFQNYAWGRICYEMTIRSLKKAMPLSAYVLKGFPFAFQVWALEAIPSLKLNFAFKKGHQLPRIFNWRSNGIPRSTKVVEFLKQKNLQVYPVLEPTDEEKQQEYLCPFLSSVSCEGSSVDRHLVKAPKVGANDVGMKRKLKIEDAKHKELCSAPRKLKARFGDSNSLSAKRVARGSDSNQLSSSPTPEASHVNTHSALPAPVDINDVNTHLALAAPGDINDFNSQSALHAPEDINVANSHLALLAPVDITDATSNSALHAHMEITYVNSNSDIPTPLEVNDMQMTQPPVLREEHALFERIKLMLEMSPQDFLPSPQSTTIPSEEINQAKCLLQPVYKMKIEQLANRSEQLESSIRLLLEAGHFPPCVLDRVKSFHKNIAREIWRHSNNCERINKFEKNKEESEMLKEELKKMKSCTDLIANQTATETQKFKQLSESMSSKEAEVKHLAESTKASADAYSRNVLRLKKLEVDKQEVEKEKEKILKRWDEFWRMIGKHL